MTPHCSPAHFCAFFVLLRTFAHFCAHFFSLQNPCPRRDFFRTGSFTEIKFAVQNAFLKFSATAGATVELTASAEIFRTQQLGLVKTVTLTGTGADQYVAIAAKTASITYAVNGEEIKTSQENTLAVGKIYPLGKLTPKIYLKPNSNWNDAGARFAAYFFVDNNTFTWVNMEASEIDGIYEVIVPSDKDYTSVILCRMNPSSTTNGWTADTQLWNQTKDLTIPTNNSVLYTVEEGAWSKGNGSWGVLPELLNTTITVTAFNHSSWTGDIYLYAFTSQNGVDEWPGTKLTIVSDKKMTAVVPINYLEGDKVQFVVSTNNGNSKTADSEKYEITEARTIYFTDTDILNEEPAPEPEEPVKNMLYLDATFWDPNSARFAAYFFGSGEKWVSMTAVSGKSGIYEVEVPAGFEKKNVIFCRMNKSASANNWNNKWNQTGNLSVNGNIGKIFKVSQWDNQTTGWSAYN